MNRSASAAPRDPPRAGGRPRRRRWTGRWLIGLALAAAITALAGGAAQALWTQSIFGLGGSLATADLDVAVGDLTWSQVTPGVASPASGQLAATPTDFFSMPGDIVEISAPVTAYLKGANLAAALFVGYADPGSADPTLSVGFHVEDEAGNRVAPLVGEAQLGEAVTIPGLTGDSEGVTTRWTVVVRVTVGGDFSWLTTPTAGSAFASWDIGTLDFDLVQVRQGPGFVTDSAPGSPGP